jgi:hypothetical protein
MSKSYLNLKINFKSKKIFIKNKSKMLKLNYNRYIKKLLKKNLKFI